LYYFKILFNFTKNNIIKSKINKLYQSHNKWVNTALKFGCSREDAEDIVGDMYLTITKMLSNGLDISYKDDINYFYIYKCLKSNYLQLYNKRKKENSISLDNTNELTDGEYINFYEANTIIEEQLDKMHWYNKKVFNLIQNEYNITELSRKTNIPYHSLYNTYKNTKQKLIKSII